MQFSSITVLLAALSTAVLADRMTITTKCPCNGCGSCNSHGTFFTDFGAYGINANEGCRGTGVPGMVDFCVDWGRGRGHFQFSHQSFKRCLLMRSRVSYGCEDAHTCDVSEWVESPCTWRMDPGNFTVVETSATPAIAAPPVSTAQVFEA